MEETRGSLAEQWREQIDRVTDLSLRLYSLEDDDPSSSVRSEALEAELDIARNALAAIEAELVGSR
jgi:hypothetical protein